MHIAVVRITEAAVHTTSDTEQRRFTVRSQIAGARSRP
jgi:hypothetical protein